MRYSNKTMDSEFLSTIQPTKFSKEDYIAIGIGDENLIYVVNHDSNFCLYSKEEDDYKIFMQTRSLKELVFYVVNSYTQFKNLHLGPDWKFTCLSVFDGITSTSFSVSKGQLVNVSAIEEANEDFRERVIPSIIKWYTEVLIK